jgi:hypothetical protein
LGQLIRTTSCTGFMLSRNLSKGEKGLLDLFILSGRSDPMKANVSPSSIGDGGLERRIQSMRAIFL